MREFKNSATLEVLTLKRRCCVSLNLPYMSSGAEHVLKNKEGSKGLVLGIPNIADTLYYQERGLKKNIDRN